MITVTESAKGLLKEILTAHSDDPEMGVRLLMNSPGQLGLVLGEEEPGDQVFEHQGAKVLLVSPDLAMALEEITLDVRDTDDGPKLVVQKE